MIPGVKPQLVSTSGPLAGVLKPVRTNRLKLTAFADSDREDGVGVSELQIDGLEDLRYTSDPASPTGLLCGFGPTIELGGLTVSTRVTGTLGAMVNGGELEVQPCDADAVRLGAGTQRIRVTNPDGFAVSSLELVPATSSDVAASAPTSEITYWSPTERRVTVRAEDEGVLALSQSFNRGWQASVDGSRLAPVVIDGWKQAWRLPAGTAGQVTMHFEPQGRFRLGIVLGLVLAALLGAAALGTLIYSRRRPHHGPASGAPVAGTRGTTPRWRELSVVVGAGVVAALVSVPLLVGGLVGYLTRRATFAGLSVACLGGLLVAAVVTILDPGSVLSPPAAADVIVALVVGAVAGHVFSHRTEPGEDER